MRLIDADAYPCAECGSAYCITNCDKYWAWFHATVDAVPIDFHERCLRLEIQKRLAAEKAAPKWISVQDRLPEDCVDVLVYAIGNNENDVVAMTSYTHNMYGYNIEGWRSPWQYFFYEYKITHWMPLPEPPKMDGETNGQ